MTVQTAFDDLFARMRRNSVPDDATRQDQIRATWAAYAHNPPSFPFRAHLFEPMPRVLSQAEASVAMAIPVMPATFNKRMTGGPGWRVEEIYSEDVILERRTFRP